MIDYCGLDGFTDRILTNAVLKNTRYEEYCDSGSRWAMRAMLQDESLGKHTVEVKDKDGYSIKIDAYHISFEDLISFKCILKMSNAMNSEIPDAIQYEIQEFKSPNDIVLAECYHEYISLKKTVKRNRYDSNLDTYGTQMGMLATRCYFFYNVDSKKYIIIDGSYWCM